MKLLQKAIDIQIQRETSYGSFPEALNLTAEILSKLTGKNFCGKDVALMFAINKLVREKEMHKEDNLVDAVNYLSVISEETLTQESDKDWVNFTNAEYEIIIDWFSELKKSAMNNPDYCRIIYKAYTVLGQEVPEEIKEVFGET